MRSRLVVALFVVFFFFLPASYAQIDSLGVYVDLGHGGNDLGSLGATIPNYSEKDINLQIGLILRDILDLFSPDTYVFSRETDTTVFLIPRVYEAMGLNSKSLISIHHNSTTSPDVQYTTGLFSSLPLSDDSANNGSPGTYLNLARNIDHKLAQKVALKIDQAFRYELSYPDTLIGISGVLDATNTKTMLSRTTMASVISEASFISDPEEEENFYYDFDYHRVKEASAIFDAWESWRMGQGFGKVDYAYTGQTPTDSHKVRVHDYLNEEFDINDTTFAPYLGVWNLDQAIMLDAINFNQNGYTYQFYRWEHKNHYDSSIISTCQTLNWVFNVDSAQDSTHWYVAYFKGGPFDVYTNTITQMNVGTLDTIQWTCNAGVENTGTLILQLSRNGGSSWTILDTLPYNGDNGNYLFTWNVTGPATQTAQLRFLAFDYVENKDTFVTNNFIICDGSADMDCDGAVNASDNCPTISNSNQQDSDGDGDGNVCDNCPSIANANQSNADIDIWGDACDNCPNVFQANQSNLDGDNFGDLCDNCIDVANNNQADSDADGSGNVCDNCSNIYNPNQQDTDNDGLGDVCDTVLNWQVTYNTSTDKVAYSIRQNNFGGYVLCGHMQSAPGPFSNGQQLNLVAISSGGSVTDDRNYIGLGTESGSCVRIRPDSTYLAVGKTSTSEYTYGGLDMFLVKLTKFFNLSFVRHFGGVADDEANHIEVTSDGGCIIAGYTKSFGVGNADFYIVKTNSSFDMQWSKTFGGTQADYAYSIQPTVDGGYAVAGITNSFGAGNTDMYLLKLNSSGDSVWSKTYGNANSDSLFSMRQTSDKGFVLAGSTNSIGAGLSDMFVIRTDSLGNVVWAKTYGGSNNDGARAIAELPDRGFFIAGYTQSYGAGASDFYVLRILYNGDTMWTRTYGDNNSEIAHSAGLTQDGGYIVAGLEYGTTLDSVTYVVKDGPLEPISCCLDTTGNVDFDLNDQCNVQDLTYVIDRIFRGGPPPLCLEESDVNGDGQNCNALDMTFLIDFFFRGGPAPSHPCNQFVTEMLAWSAH